MASRTAPLSLPAASEQDPLSEQFEAYELACMVQKSLDQARRARKNAKRRLKRGKNKVLKLKISYQIGESDDEVFTSEDEETDAHFYDEMSDQTFTSLSKRAFETSFDAKQRTAWVMHSTSKLKKVAYDIGDP